METDRVPDDARLATARARPPDQHPAVSRADAHRRFPGAALRRWITARDHTCRGIGCAHDAVTTDIDHTESWEDDGDTVAEDLGAFCRADHLFKHDPSSGWTVEQPEPGHFVWTDPNEERHHRRPEPHDPLPDERPPAAGGFSIPAEAFLPLIVRPDTPGAARPDRHGRTTPRARATATHLERRRRAQNGDPPHPEHDDEPPF